MDEEVSICFGIIVIIIGVINFALYHYRVDWFMNMFKNRVMLKTWSEKGFAVLYTVTSILIVAVGFLFMFGLVK